ncbi:MAG: aminotransferase class I/II-fold pyridoxal phosphate-dependent enzyme [Lentimicrobium sp.]|jgi:aromatic-L-amino-acid decarboxylase|nr:aminotransferase class I/II-fold pyridoxal phosphate-dependent enzyme [Lentimicrobium sp.]MDD2527385.1 aminotransferase class I/II-fold pyridoxal phosphate-dependent enzyme [Lentimicrobiaceae bacterium]MDD4598626.1 aminotransferase class I/II-fold pyridoxal phosphate-dependent enzyme [Lentimicrobiaceae bacterium]MDY0025274.1 aminotransferase class I/II-fold pyridoxal phosphate-dependent enzyme [Lentimicrobium sp.]
MKTPAAFRAEAHRMADRMADYFEQIEQYPVKSQVKPGEILGQLPATPPGQPESMAQVMADFDRIILPGITHWQNPNFFAFFPANSSYPSVLAEMLTAALGQQGMIWETSPAAAELEERVMEWLKQMCGLPDNWTGVIQDTASASTLAALLTAREKVTGFRVNEEGSSDTDKLRVYCSTETHSSIEKAVKIAGIGRKNLVKVAVDKNFSMQSSALHDTIEADLEAGFQPLCVIATIGTTGSTAVDPIRQIGKICSKNNIWLHVDAAYAGTAMVLPEMRHFADGLELADSYVFNPHKWMFTNFDCSAYFVRDPQMLIRTFEILPEYLKTRTRGQVNDYRDWGVALGRRFRALKLWFVIRNFGVEGIRQKVRLHLELAQWLASEIRQSADFELLAPVDFSLVCFRYLPSGITDEASINEINERLLQTLNAGGKLYMTHTKLNGKYTLRMVIAQTYVEKHHVENAWKLIRETAGKI